MRLCPICGEPAEIICDIDEYYWWAHSCDNNVKIESSSIYASEKDAIVDWDAYCYLLDTYGEAMANG